MKDEKALDVVVVGGSYAGMSAALQLARARRAVAVVDSGLRRNRFASASHGFLGQDGRPPGEIAAAARDQLLAYPNVRWLVDTATSASGGKDDFLVSTAGGTVLRSRRLLLASGVVDELPPLEGLAERWGQSVFHCPYCHGYELEQGPIGVLASGPHSLHQAMLLPDWGTVTLFLNQAFEPDAAQRAALATRAVSVEEVPVVRLSETATAELADGRRVELAGVFVTARTRMASPLPEQLGCEFDQGPLGPFLRRNGQLETTVPGVFACGDAALPVGNVAIAVGDGAQAGFSLHKSLIPGL